MKKKIDNETRENRTIRIVKILRSLFIVSRFAFVTFEFFKKRSINKLFVKNKRLKLIDFVKITNVFNDLNDKIDKILIMKFFSNQF